jgi:uncharacterized coiled-coil protein SlyX
MDRAKITAAVEKFRDLILREKEIVDQRFDVECDLESIAEIVAEAEAAIAEEQGIIDRAKAKVAALEEHLEKLSRQESEIAKESAEAVEGLDDETLDDIYNWVHGELEDGCDRSAEALVSVYLMEKRAEDDEQAEQAEGGEE